MSSIVVMAHQVFRLSFSSAVQGLDMGLSLKPGATSSKGFGWQSARLA